MPEIEAKKKDQGKFPFLLGNNCALPAEEAKVTAKNIIVEEKKKTTKQQLKLGVKTYGK